MPCQRLCACVVSLSGVVIRAIGTIYQSSLLMLKLSSYVANNMKYISSSEQVYERTSCVESLRRSSPLTHHRATSYLVMKVSRRSPTSAAPAHISTPVEFETIAQCAGLLQVTVHPTRVRTGATLWANLVHCGLPSCAPDTGETRMMNGAAPDELSLAAATQRGSGESERRTQSEPAININGKNDARPVQTTLGNCLEPG